MNKIPSVMSLVSIGGCKKAFLSGVKAFSHSSVHSSCNFFHEESLEWRCVLGEYSDEYVKSGDHIPMLCNISMVVEVSILMMASNF